MAKAIRALVVLFVVVGAALFGACHHPTSPDVNVTVIVPPGTDTSTVIPVDTTKPQARVVLDTVMLAPDSLRCDMDTDTLIEVSVHQVDTAGVVITPNVLHQSIALHAADAGIASAAGKRVSCKAPGNTFFVARWTNGTVVRTRTIWVTVNIVPTQ